MLRQTTAQHAMEDNPMSPQPNMRQDTEDALEDLTTMTSALSMHNRARMASVLTPNSAARPGKRTQQPAASKARKDIQGYKDMQASSSDDKENCPNSSSFKARVTPSRLDRIGDLQAELTCCICLEICVRPSTTACGHTFCRSCLRQSLAHSDTCPKCRTPVPPGPLKINTALWNTICLLFPKLVDSQQSITPEVHQAAPVRKTAGLPRLGLARSSNSGIFSSGRRSSNSDNNLSVLTNPFRPPRRAEPAAARELRISAGAVHRTRTLLQSRGAVSSLLPSVQRNQSTAAQQADSGAALHTSASPPAQPSRLQSLLDEIAQTAADNSAAHGGQERDSGSLVSQQPAPSTAGQPDAGAAALLSASQQQLRQVQSIRRLPRATVGPSSQISSSQALAAGQGGNNPFCRMLSTAATAPAGRFSSSSSSATAHVLTSAASAPQQRNSSSHFEAARECASGSATHAPNGNHAMLLLAPHSDAVAAAAALASPFFSSQAMPGSTRGPTCASGFSQHAAIVARDAEFTAGAEGDQDSENEDDLSPVSRHMSATLPSSTSLRDALAGRVSLAASLQLQGLGQQVPEDYQRSRHGPDVVSDQQDVRQLGAGSLLRVSHSSMWDDIGRHARDQQDAGSRFSLPGTRSWQPPRAAAMSTDGVAARPHISDAVRTRRRATAPEGRTLLSTHASEVTGTAPNDVAPHSQDSGNAADSMALPTSLPPVHPLHLQTFMQQTNLRIDTSSTAASTQVQPRSVRWQWPHVPEQQEAGLDDAERHTQQHQLRLGLSIRTHGTHSAVTSHENASSMQPAAVDCGLEEEKDDGDVEDSTWDEEEEQDGFGEAEENMDEEALAASDLFTSSPFFDAEMYEEAQAHIAQQQPLVVVASGMQIRPPPTTVGTSSRPLASIALQHNTMQPSMDPQQAQHAEQSPALGSVHRPIELLSSSCEDSDADDTAL